MEGSVEPRCIGIRLVKDSYLDWRLSKKQRKKSTQKKLCGHPKNCTVNAEKLCGHPKKTTRV
jgi:hypothetical protein